MSEAFRKDPTGYLLLGLTLMFLIGVGLAAWLYRRSGHRSLFEFEPRPLVPWGGISVLAAMALYIALYSAASPPKDKAAGLSVRENLLRFAAVNVGFVLLLPPLLRATSGARLGDLGVTPRDLKRNTLRGMVACALALPPVYLVLQAAVMVWTPQDHIVEKAIATDRSGLTGAIAAIGAAIAAPAAEELLFRGVLLATLWKLGAKSDGDEPDDRRVRGPGEWNASVDLIANAAVSMLFCSLHADQWPAPIPLFLLSMGLGEVYRRTGSLVAPIAMHAAFNTLSLLALLIASALGLLPTKG